MNNLSQKNKVRSFIYDIPTRSYINSLSTEDSSLQQNYGVSALNIPRKFELPKNFSCETKVEDLDQTEKINPERLKFYINFLPYINAQNGYHKSQSSIASIKPLQTSDSLPLIRRRNQINLLDTSPRIPDSAYYTRNKSLQTKSIKDDILSWFFTYLI